jgi:hypothetical protein
LNALSGQIAGGLAVLVVLLFLFKRLGGGGGKASRHPYQKQPTFFSADERAFFLTLKESTAGEYEIFAKIPVGDIITSKKDSPRAAAEVIEGRRFDFVLCDPKTLSLVCAIQLQGQAEAEPLQAICESLGLPFQRFPSHVAYSPAEIRDALRKATVKEPFYLVETDGRKEPRISNLDDMKF